MAFVHALLVPLTSARAANVYCCNENEYLKFISEITCISCLKQMLSCHDFGPLWCQDLLALMVLPMPAMRVLLSVTECLAYVRTLQNA